LFGVASFLPSQAGRRLAAILGAVALLVLLAPAASAEATITRDTITIATVDTGLTDDCRPGITGTLVATLVINFQRVDTQDGFHVDETDTSAGLLTWSDGSYSIVSSVDHFTRNIFDSGMRVRTLTHEDSVNTYTADGVFLFRLTFQEVQHITFIDGAYVVNLDYGHFRTFGAC